MRRPLLRVATFLDPVRYADGLLLLEGLAAARVAGTVPDTVLVLEHHPVYTLGRRGLESHLRGLAPGTDVDAWAAASGAEVAASPRGGEATWHGPGQAVLYPVASLRPLGLGARAYVDALEDAMIGAAARWGVRADARVGGKGPGAWVGERKLGAVGVRISRGVTSHGLAFNACPDLTAFDAIIPCGTDVGPGGDRPVTSLDEELRREWGACSAGGVPGGPLVGVEEVGAAVVRELADRIGWEVEAVEPATVVAEAEAALLEVEEEERRRAREQTRRGG